MKMALILIAMLAATPAGPRVKKIYDDEDYVAVRVDAFMAMEAAETNLPICEKSLSQAQKDLGQAQAHVDELHAAAKALEQQKKDLEAHITRLESLVKIYENKSDRIVDQIGQGWEEVDGTVGLVAGWAVGTGQCIGLAYVFNQPAFR